MGTIIAGLKWLATFLEKRFPEPMDPAQYVLRAEFKATMDAVSSVIQQDGEKIQAVERENTKLKEQLEKISLLIGLSRPMQTVLRQGGSK